MAEPHDVQEAQSVNLERWIGIARRRHVHFLIPMFLGWLVVWGASWVLPARYRSGTLILVEQPTMPKDYVTPNINDDLRERLQSITQQILSRTHLLHIIDDLNLYSRERGLNNPDAKVERMRKDIEIELVRDGQEQVTAFNVYYSSKDAHVAQQVTTELTNLFINENLEVRQRESEGTTQFLESQLETARQTLATQEERIREFKGKHLQELPSQLASNLQILGGLQSQLQSEEDALNAAQQQHVYLGTLLTQYRGLEKRSTSSDNAGASLTAIDQELEKLKSDLADLSSRYTERHPDVRALKDQIARTERMRARLMLTLKGNGEKSQPQPDVDETFALHGTDLNPISAQAQLRSQLQANETEIANRNRVVADLKAKVEDYQARLNQEPVREQQLSDLTRGYDQSKANFDELLKKKNESAMATSMERLQQGERFRIVDPPSLPLKPDFPNRLKFCGIGIVLGLVLGGAVVGVFEMMDDRMHSEKDIKELISVPVISEIPVITNLADEEATRKRIWLGWASAAIAVTAILAGSAISFLRG